jgi:hypothetical protein
MKQVFSILALALVFGCKPDPTELEIPQAPEKIVVASQQIEGNVLVMVFTKSFGALEHKTVSPGSPLPEELLIQNASVQLAGGGQSISLQEISPGVYATETLTGINYASYTIQVNHPESGLSVESQAQMLPKVALDTFGVLPVAGTNNQYVLHYAFTDIPSQQNWYVVNYYTKDNARDSFPGNPLDVDYIAKRLLEQRLEFDLISEADIVNGGYQITKRFTNNQLDTFGIALSNISQGYYEFLKAQQKYGSLTNKLRGEVVNMPTNISNGYGYFNLHTPDAHVIRIER